MNDVNAAWLMGAALGVPVVPAVNSSAAAALGSASGKRVSSAPPRASNSS